MDAYEAHLASQKEGYILVVDDVATTRATHSLMLTRLFEVKNAASGQEAIALCAERQPDLILLDVEMPGLNGFDTCRQLREHYDLPIIFVTSHESLDEHLKAFDAGGSDICVKPVTAELLIRKARVAIAQWRERKSLQAEQNQLQKIAGQYQSSLSERRQLLQFTRASLSCENHAQLARNLLHACERQGLQGCIAIRQAGEDSAWGAEGDATALERAVLNQVASMGRMLQFKNRLALNQGSITLVISNMPDEASEDAARIRDNMAALVEISAALADRISAQSSQAEATQEPASNQRKQAADIRLLLQEMLDRLQATFDLMATDHHQEERILEAVREPVERIIALLDQGR